jgi:hypothetical protein
MDVTNRPEDTRVAAWRDWAKADAEHRGLPELASLIDGLATTIARLRAAGWNADARQASAASNER